VTRTLKEVLGSRGRNEYGNGVKIWNNWQWMVDFCCRGHRFETKCIDWSFVARRKYPSISTYCSLSTSSISSRERTAQKQANLACRKHAQVKEHCLHHRNDHRSTLDCIVQSPRHHSETMKEDLITQAPHVRSKVRPINCSSTPEDVRALQKRR
jgi:hypothetical protein